jgi:hypothetical protein
MAKATCTPGKSMTPRRMIRALLALTFSVSLQTFAPRGAVAANGVFVEGVSDYSVFRSFYGDGTGDIWGMQDATGFLTTMAQSGSPWVSKGFYGNNNVWDYDFIDPEITHNTSDADWNGIDRKGVAFAYASMHGSCDDVTTQNCLHGSDCPSGQACVNTPPSVYSTRCVRNTPRCLVTSSTTSGHGQFVYYGNSTVKWGEDSFSGGWAGAGTNGGANVIFVRNSCGSRSPFFWNQTYSAYAGAMLIFWTLNQSAMSGGPNSGSSDTFMSPTDGQALANLALMNPNNSIASVEFLAMSQRTVGTSCPDQTSTFTYGGGQGYSGCAADVAIAWDSTQAAATANVQNLTWNQAADSSHKAHGNSYGFSWFHCNYDCNLYQMTK